MFLVCSCVCVWVCVFEFYVERNQQRRNAGVNRQHPELALLTRHNATAVCSRFVVNAAGLYADRVALVSCSSPFSFFGDISNCLLFVVNAAGLYADRVALVFQSFFFPFSETYQSAFCLWSTHPLYPDRVALVFHFFLLLFVGDISNCLFLVVNAPGCTPTGLLSFPAPFRFLFCWLIASSLLLWVKRAERCKYHTHTEKHTYTYTHTRAQLQLCERTGVSFLLLT
jgi:hypothetical protein